MGNRNYNLPPCYHHTPYLYLPTNFPNEGCKIFILEVLGFMMKTQLYLKTYKADFRRCCKHFLVTASPRVCFTKHNVIGSAFP